MLKLSVKRVMGLVIILSMICSLISGCTSTTSEGKKDDSINITISQPIFSKTAQGTAVQKLWQEKMEKHLGKKLNIKWQEAPFSEYVQKLPVYLASGDFADIFTVVSSSTNDQVVELGRQGLIVDINKYADKATNYMKLLNESDNKQRISTTEGNVYGFTDAQFGNHNGTQIVHIARFDIFKKHNLKIPETLQEYYETAKKLKELYPDSYPIGSYVNPLDVFLLINHTYPKIYFNGQKYVFPLIDDEDRVKETLQFMNKLYSEGLIDPEFFTASADQAEQKLLTGKSFLVPYTYGSRITSKYNAYKDNPAMEWGVIPQPNNMHGEKAWNLSCSNPGKHVAIDYQIVISSKAKNPELLVKLVDYQYSDEMIELANWGIEGQTFEKKNGVNEYTSTIINAADSQTALAEYGVNMSMSVRSGIQFMPQDTNAYLQAYKPVPVYDNGNYSVENFWKFTARTITKEGMFPGDYQPPISFTQDEKTTETNTMNPIYTYMQESMIKFIIGSKKFDEWDTFKEKLLSMGDYKKIIDTYNKKIK